MTKAAATDRTIDATSTGPCTPISPTRGMLAGSRGIKSRNNQCADTMPRQAPAMANGIVSAKNCRASRDRVAPRDARSENSCARLVALARRRFARLTQTVEKQDSDRREQQEKCVANGACHVIEHGLDEHAGTPIGLRMVRARFAASTLM